MVIPLPRPLDRCQAFSLPERSECAAFSLRRRWRAWLAGCGGKAAVFSHSRRSCRPCPPGAGRAGENV